ncbi:MAG: iron chelate uptake ABC transporter family permease subunit, partial [Actinomycetes bacterium]
AGGPVHPRGVLGRLHRCRRRDPVRFRRRPGFQLAHLEALAIGDEIALTLGTHPARFRIQVFILVSICVGADVVARVALQSAEVPIGIITAIVGTPFLIVLVRRFHAALT